MRLALRRRRPAERGNTVSVLEIVTPRTNTATLSSAENFFASVSASEPFCVEIATDSERRRFLVRAANDRVLQQLRNQLSAAYPQAEVRTLPAERDPALLQDGEQLAACTLALRAPAYLPLRTFIDLDLDGERAAQADPVLGILSALGDLPPGWRGLSQVVLLPAPEDWSRGVQRFSVQHPLEHERVRRGGESALPLLVFLLVLLFVLLIGQQGYALYRARLWLQLCALALSAVGVTVAGAWLFRRLNAATIYDMELVREKVTRIACRAEVRLLVFGPPNAPRVELERYRERLAVAYRRFNLAGANGFVPRRAASERAWARAPRPWSKPRALPILTTLELAGMWHLPHAAADVALLERTTARRWLPLPAAVADGCRIGTSRQQEREVPVAVPRDVLRRHLLLVAKTRRGKSTLMQRLAHAAMLAQPSRAVLLLDPHRDLADATLGVVPAARNADVVFLDVSDRTRPFGLNLLDTGLGWDRDRAVNNTLAVFQREWGDRYWGPRMEDAFRFALLTLYEANLAMCRTDPLHGRAAQYTVLEVPALLSDAAFRREVLDSVTDPSLQLWWSRYFDTLERRFQLEVINPVLTKVHRFEGNRDAQHIIGQSASTIDPAAWLRDGAIVIVNTARGVVGENAAALIGSTLLNLVTLGVAEQARVHAGARFPISMFVDEFHTIPGADYEGILSELNKYGANLVLATQSLARLLAIGEGEGRGLRATVFANLDGLFAFNCSAEDAEYLVPELGGALDEQDLVELGEHQCYVRLTSAGSRLPSFWVQLDPPLRSDIERAAALAQSSAERFGRDANLVVAERRAAADRVQSARARQLASAQQAVEAEPHSRTPDATHKKPARNEHRPRKRRAARQQEVAPMVT